MHNSVFYCVANMPGAVPNTSTYALTNATLPYAVALADKGWEQALRDDRSLALGLNTHAGPADQRAGRRGARAARSVSLDDGAGLSEPRDRDRGRPERRARASAPTSTTWWSSAGWPRTR